MKRVLVYSHDTFGLGNIRRMLEVARHLVASSEDVSVLLVTGSPMLHAMRLPPRVDTLKLPCLSRSVDGRYGARFLDLSLAATVRLRANLIRSTIADFAPDLILVDKKPFGVEDELSGVLGDTHPEGPRPRRVLLLRDILDSPQATQHVWRKNGCFEAIEAYYDEVLVLGSPEVFDLRHEYAFPPFAAAKVNFCGYIARQPGSSPRESVRAALQVAPEKPLVLVTPGGGEDGHMLVMNYLQGLAAMPAAQRPRSHIVCGPEMAEAQRLMLEQAAAALPQASLQVFSDDMMSLMAAAEVVVCMGGYNTVCELLSLRRRAVVVPRIRPGQEQLIRAQRLSERGLLRWRHPDDLSPQALMADVMQELAAATNGSVKAHLQGMNGLAHCSAALLAQLGLPMTAPGPVPRAARPTSASARFGAHVHSHAAPRHDSALF
jgi:predicted glycosyltransferase